MADNINDILKNKARQTDGAVSVPNPNFNANEMLKQATGMDLDPSHLPPTPTSSKDREFPEITVNRTVKPEDASMEGKPEFAPMSRAAGVQNLPRDIGPQSISRIKVPGMPPTQQNAKASDLKVVSGDDAAQTWEEKIDLDKEVQKEADRKYQKHQQEAIKGITDMFDDAIAEEADRADRLENILGDPESRDKLYQDENGNVDVHHSPAVQLDSTGAEIVRRKKPRDGAGKDPVLDAAMYTDDVDELLPSYGEDDEEEKVEEKETPVATDEEEEKAPDPADEVAYAKYIYNLEHTVIPSDDQHTVIKTIKNRQVDVIPSGRSKGGKYLNDQAFLNSITKFKKDNFATVSVPLVNSGFVVDIVGTGEVDLIQLYSRVDDSTARVDYEIEKMKIMIRNIVGTHPKVNPMDLRNMIHYRDYNLLAWGLVCATLDNIEIITNCTECGKPFRITSSPRAMVMNMDELEKRMNEIRNADSIEQCSLMTTNKKLVTSDHFEVVIGHPSYADYIRVLNQIKEWIQGKSQFETQRFFQIAEILYYIRNIALPSGVITANTQQHYMAMNMLKSADVDTIADEINEMRKDVINANFGVAKVTCPHCGKVMVDTPYDNIDDMVFYHSTVSRMLQVGSKETVEK